MTNTTSAIDQVAMPAPSVREQRAFVLPGGLMACLGLILLAAGVTVGIMGINDQSGLLIGLAVGILLIGIIVLAGLIMVQPREARVIQFLGRYTGTVRDDGLRWVNPLTTRTKVSTRIRNHETTVLKVNDADGSPIEIAAVVVWHVEDSARAMFEVDSFVRFVQTQTETAVRHIATSYPYDSDDPKSTSLRENAEDITEQLSTEIGVRVESAGVRVIESRLTHLAYAPEIAQAMLQRQQAGAVVAARTRIVEGAVGMVEMALDKIAEQGVVELDEERKAAMVSNLLVVLCGDRSTQPVVNAGSLYH
ncbi:MULTISPECIES: SPFH domain-containing protein [Actinoalloteichus]|uniref:SPFH domain-containing protein n=1 Tax=Actinoalloteichus fjordicus TaxID=1612552 RepID=A0AAC9PRD7_9PSEU|nr:MULTISPECIES: SPFH domain-containing protein [Actinoalloteichus]APU13731.1 SPFH domain-containing protein [Actinoalloteichus fjordicus]APU19677.1 SPFH domain-containing protein [Actinoalloteichus sp. GBA129-24]